MLKKENDLQIQLRERFKTDNWPESPFNKNTSRGTYGESNDDPNLYVGCSNLLPLAHWIVSRRGPVLICQTCMQWLANENNFNQVHISSTT